MENQILELQKKVAKLEEELATLKENQNSNTDKIKEEIIKVVLAAVNDSYNVA